MPAMKLTVEIDDSHADLIRRVLARRGYSSDPGQVARVLLTLIPILLRRWAARRGEALLKSPDPEMPQPRPAADVRRDFWVEVVSGMGGPGLREGSADGK
jgi:hypothetical protein